MPLIGFRRAAALLAAVALVAAAPAVATPDRSTTEDLAGRDLVPSVTAWLTGIWADMMPSATPGPAREAHGPALDPNGASQATAEEPTTEAELGPDADPNG